MLGPMIAVAGGADHSPSALLHDPAQHAAPSPVDYRHVHLSTEHHRHAVGKEQQGRETAVDVGVKSQAVATGIRRPLDVLRGTCHPEPVHLERAHNAPAYGRGQEPPIVGHRAGPVSRTRVQVHRMEGPFAGTAEPCGEAGTKRTRQLDFKNRRIGKSTSNEMPAGLRVDAALHLRPRLCQPDAFLLKHRSDDRSPLRLVLAAKELRYLENIVVHLESVDRLWKQVLQLGRDDRAVRRAVCRAVQGAIRRLFHRAVHLPEGSRIALNPVAMTVTLIWSPSDSSITAPKMTLASVSAALEMTPAASLTSNSPMSGPPLMLRRMPVAPSMDDFKQRRRDGRLGGLDAAVLPAGQADAHQGRPRVAHDGSDVGEVQVDEPRNSDEVGDALHALAKDVVGHLEGLDDGGTPLDHLKQAIVGDDYQGIDLLGQGGDARLGLAGPLPALEGEGLGDHAHGESAQLAGDLGDDRAPLLYPCPHPCRR